MTNAIVLIDVESGKAQQPDGTLPQIRGHDLVRLGEPCRGRIHPIRRAGTCQCRVGVEHMPVPKAARVPRWCGPRFLAISR